MQTSKNQQTQQVSISITKKQRQDFFKVLCNNYKAYNKNYEQYQEQILKTLNAGNKPSVELLTLIKNSFELFNKTEITKIQANKRVLKGILVAVMVITFCSLILHLAAPSILSAFSFGLMLFMTIVLAPIFMAVNSGYNYNLELVQVNNKQLINQLIQKKQQFQDDINILKDYLKVYNTVQKKSATEYQAEAFQELLKEKSSILNNETIKNIYNNIIAEIKPGKLLDNEKITAVLAKYNIQNHIINAADLHKKIFSKNHQKEAFIKNFSSTISSQEDKLGDIYMAINKIKKENQKSNDAYIIEKMSKSHITIQAHQRFEESQRKAKYNMQFSR